MRELSDESFGLEALKLAEEKVEYIAFKKIDRNSILKKIKAVIAGFKQIEKAYIYGSFARKQDGPKSDIDIAFKNFLGEKGFNNITNKKQANECLLQTNEL